ncbi:FecR family protein [Sinomicrobium oceani]|uniref:FecR family protein n=1 Tax=Sinomicrobium oceani TaxID=1150368 RepID=UPI00227A786D|nr:FecR family protein [Sinomicrobium oceani]
MKNKKSEHFLVKYLHSSATEAELDMLDKQIRDPEQKSVLKALLNVLFITQIAMNKPDPDKIKDTLRREIKKDGERAKRLRRNKYLRYAAVGMILLSLGYFFIPPGPTEKPADKISMPSDGEITLELSNGNVEVISESGDSRLVNEKGTFIGNQKGNRITYTKKTDNPELFSYNQLTVPYGKRFELELSDGTIVYLNSGSSLKYPVNFPKDRERLVYLSGEAYLDVAKDNSRPFIVNANTLNIKVLGTQFNISTYPEDQTTDVVLIEGSVSLHIENADPTADAPVLLKPGFKGSFNKRENHITTKAVITETYTSWLKGELIFRNMTFGNILKKLERHYNVTITNENLEYRDKKFNANLGNEPIEEVLKYFKNTYDIDYKIDDRHITVK